MPYIKGDFDVFNGVMAIHISLVVPRQKLARKEVEKKNVAVVVALKIFWKPRSYFFFFFFLFHLRVL